MNLLEGTLADGRFRSEGADLALPAASGKVTLGVRPEHVTLAEARKGDFTGRVFASELLGDCTILSVKTGTSLVSAKLPPEVSRAIGDTVALNFERGRLHVFDSATGERRGEA